MSITVRGSTDRMSRRLNSVVSRQIPFAASKALNDTGNVLLALNKAQMRRQFDNPVRYTLNAFYMKPARKNNLVMSIRRKGAQGSKHYLEVQHKGGARPRKAVGGLISASIPGYSGSVVAVTPTKHSTRNNGAINMSQVYTALAGVRASPQSQSAQRQVQRAGERLARRKKPVEYFVGYKEQGKNKTDGIYKREGNRIKKIIHILNRRPTYSKRFPFQPPLVKHARSYLPSRLRANLSMAIRTARV